MNEETHTVEVAEANNCVVLCDKCAGFCNQDAITFPDKDEIKALIAGILREMKEPRTVEGASRPQGHDPSKV